MKNALVLIAVILLSGCATTPIASGPEADYQNAEALAQENKYLEAIAAYRKLADDSPQAPLAADSLFEASYLQAFYGNPQKDYAQALAGFEEFLKRFPKHAKAREAKNWRAVLKTIVDAKKENERLRKSIEELNKLDIRHEERRQGR
jgi:outer membrane protein assembly factor BamD (BamD/ComL family)